METIKANKEKTAKALPFNKLVDALERGFALECVQPERQHLNMEKNDQTTPIMLVMPAWSKPEDDKQYLGVKIVNIYPDNRLKNLPGLTSTYILYNGKTGEELAILDGNTLTARRTAATSRLWQHVIFRFYNRKNWQLLVLAKWHNCLQRPFRVCGRLKK